MKNSILHLVFFSFLMSLTANAFAFAVSYDQKVSIENNPVATIKVAVQGENMRAESDFGGMKSVMLRNETGSYSYVPEQNAATKIPPAMDRPNLTRDLPRFMEFLNSNKGEKVGSEKVDGKDCDVYKFLEPTIQQEAKAWVWKEKQFPVKIEVPAPEGLTVVELYNIQFDPKLDAASFQLPAGVKVLDFEAAQQAAAAMQAQQAEAGSAPAAN
jgi:outer membrane lipoprotein-sorting protein